MNIKNFLVQLARAATVSAVQAVFDSHQVPLSTISAAAPSSSKARKPPKKKGEVKRPPLGS